jgi:putative hydrolase of the HAD superfamily
MPFSRPPRAVTFDCWSTLIYEPDSSQAREIRVAALAEIAAQLGQDLSLERADSVLQQARARHVQGWIEEIQTGSIEIAQWALEDLGLPDGEAASELARRLSQASYQQDIRALDGARETLEVLAERGIRRALICDTGFTPAPIVRDLLDRAGLLALLEVQIFSDEAGVPKPNPRVFRMALEGLGVSAGEAVHVGDLRRSDIAGARRVGMGSIRICWDHDDQSDQPEADAVAESHEHLRKLLGVS